MALSGFYGGRCSWIVEPTIVPAVQSPNCLQFLHFLAWLGKTNILFPPQNVAYLRIYAVLLAGWFVPAFSSFIYDETKLTISIFDLIWSTDEDMICDNFKFLIYNFQSITNVPIFNF